ncbi:hypothetical protein NL676_035123 [Syzygium grande]|nr:hypothetical protein NL676_035123 [Syzygium grande]
MLEQEIAAIVTVGEKAKEKVVHEDNCVKAKRASFKDVMSSFEERLAKMKLTMEDFYEEVKEQIDEVKESLRGEFSSALNVVVRSMNKRADALETLTGGLQEELKIINDYFKAQKLVIASELEMVKDELKTCKTAIVGCTP